MCNRQTHRKSFVSNIKEFQIQMYDKITFPKTSILGTIGPASFNQMKVDSANLKTDKLLEMITNGMNLIRINLAHVNDDSDKENVRLLLERIQTITHETKSAIGISVDLAGPKFRIGKLDPVTIKEDDEFILTLDPSHGVTKDTRGDAKCCSLDVEPDFKIQNVLPNQKVLIDDGLFSLIVTIVKDKEIYCRAKNTWTLQSKKGVNFPGCVLTDSALTQKDKADLRWLFGLEDGISKNGEIDFVSMSFVKTPSEISDLKAVLRMFEQQHVKVFAKIETIEAVDHENNYRQFDRILEVADGIMVARGDLGAELGIINVPEVQKELLHRANKARKATIVATQMLETMTKNRFPTRAEVTDVSNAIREGADIIMLSGETSAGIDPPGVVKMMSSIANRTESWVKTVQDDFFNKTSEDFTREDFTEAIGHPIVEWAARIDAKLILVYTTTGYTAKVISHYHPKQPIIAITHEYDTIMELNRYWGIYSALINYVPNSAEEAKQIATNVIEKLDLAHPGDTIIMTMSMGKLGIAESRDTNTIHVFKCPERGLPY